MSVSLPALSHVTTTSTYLLGTPSGSFTGTVSVSVSVKLFIIVWMKTVPSSCRMSFHTHSARRWPLSTDTMINNLRETETETVRVNEPFLPLPWPQPSLDMFKRAHLDQVEKLSCWSYVCYYLPLIALSKNFITFGLLQEWNTILTDI